MQDGEAVVEISIGKYFGVTVGKRFWKTWPAIVGQRKAVSSPASLMLWHSMRVGEWSTYTSSP